MVLAAHAATSGIDGPVVLPEADRGWLARAIALGETARGLTSPNPAVGCVLVAAGRIVGEGATRPTGDSHAEAVALSEAGATAAGSTAYTTLEPCTHQGRTPPCAQALIEAGVRRVVIGHPDPNPVATGGGQTLRDAGIEVVGPLRPGDLFYDTIAAQLEGFLLVVSEGRPFVTLKLAQTIDGELQAPAGRWVTGPEARRAVHRWRAASDGVLVGSGTVLADDPQLDVRHVRTEIQPRAIVLDARLRTPIDALVIRPGTIVVTSAEADAAQVARMRQRGVEVETVAGAEQGGVSLPPALVSLARRGINNLFAEPGLQLAQAMLDADVVDRLVIHVGRHGTGTVAIPAIAPASETTWRLERTGGAGPDGLVQLLRTRDRRPNTEEVPDVHRDR